MIEVDSAQREARAREVRHDVVATLTQGTHRTFRGVFAVQWAIAVALAWKSSLPDEPRILFTMIVGAMLSVPALLFARAAPQAAWVRHFMAACQIGWSILFMWLLEGQPEAQLHVFVSLAFLAFYRDWRVIVTATLIAIAYPIVKLALVPDTYVIGASAWWRVFDQAAWVIADAVIMLIAVLQSLKTIKKFATHSATLLADQRDHRQARRGAHARARAQPRAVPPHRRNHARHSVRARPGARPLHLHRTAGAKDARLPGSPMEGTGIPRRAAAALARVERAPATRRVHARHFRDAVLGGHRRRSRRGVALDGVLRAGQRHALPARTDDRRHRGAPHGARAGAGPEARVRGPHRRRRGSRDQHLGAIHLRQRALRAPRAARRAARARRLSRARRQRACRART